MKSLKRDLSLAIFLLAVLVIPQKSEASVSFANIGAGATYDYGYPVTDPTVFLLDNAVTTRYLRIEIRNDGTFGDGGYAELRSVKGWADGPSNILNSIYSSGSAKIVEISGYDGADPYETDLSVECDDYWHPQGSLCDESPDTNSKNISSKSNSDSGATWSIDSPSSTGVLVVDIGSVQDLKELRVFQMFSDGKTTQIRFAYHSEIGNTPPTWDDVGWNNFTDTEGLPNPPQEEQTNSEEVVNEDELDKDSKGYKCYKEHKKKYTSKSYKQDYQKVKELKKKDYNTYFKMKTIYHMYKVAGDDARDKLEQADPETYEMYKEYRRYKKYKKYRECKVDVFGD